MRTLGLHYLLAGSEAELWTLLAITVMPLLALIAYDLLKARL